MGDFGIVICFIFVLIHLSSLRSFGITYLYPISPANFKDLKKVLIRPPIWELDKRSEILRSNDKNRQANNQKPTPPRN